jgi:C-8 sterol isomerase
MAHIFDPARLHEIARAAVGLPHEPMVKTVVDGLHAAYPGHIARVPRWVISRAGGAMGMMMVLHGSLSEYVLLYGSPIGTEGFSGRYRVEVYDFVLAGEMWTYTEDAVAERVVTGPGEVAHLGRDQAKGYRLPDACWMLEYGHGPVATMLPFGLAESLVSLDFTTIGRTLAVYAPLAVRELLRGKI